MAGKREVISATRSGMGRSKLKIPSLLRDGTMRNINTLSGLVALIAKRRKLFGWRYTGNPPPS